MARFDRGDASKIADETIRAVLEALPAHVCLLDRGGTVVAVNRRWERFALENGGDLSRCGPGANALEVCRAAVEDGSAGGAEALAGIERVLTGCRESFTLETRCQTSGTTRWFLMLAAALPVEHGGAILSYVDITEQKEVQLALHESEYRLRTVIETAADGILSMNGEGVVDAMNAAAERLSGYGRGEVIGKSVLMMMPSLSGVLPEGGLERLRSLESGRGLSGTPPVAIRRKGGASVPVELSISRVDALDLYSVIMRDLSEWRAMQAQLLTVAEHEQRRIGQDLHDDVGQELTGLALMVESLVEAMEECQSPETPLVHRVSEGLRRVQEGMRNLSRGLVPVEVDAEGLMSALSDLAARIGSNHELSCGFECRETVRVENNQTATQLYRIAQEAVSNAVRHAHARRIVIRLSREGDEVRLEIRDDGRGFWPPGTQDGDGMGLRIMRNRAELIGARLRIESRDEGGTLVVCAVQGRNDDHARSERP